MNFSVCFSIKELGRETEKYSILLIVVYSLYVGISEMFCKKNLLMTMSYDHMSDFVNGHALQSLNALAFN